MESYQALDCVGVSFNALKIFLGKQSHCFQTVKPLTAKERTHGLEVPTLYSNSLLISYVLCGPWQVTSPL